MKIGSLFTGYAGLDMAVQAVLGGSVAWHCDNDPAASKVLAHHWDVPNHGDVTAVDWTTVEPVDVLTAGYPCQPFSSAGQRKGADDDRYLWPEVERAIRVLGPRLVVLENVSGHVVRGFPEVVGSLASLGYDARWTCVRASDVGACHRRERLFVAAYPGHGSLTERPRSQGRDTGQRPAVWSEPGRPGEGLATDAASQGRRLPVGDTDQRGGPVRAGETEPRRRDRVTTDADPEQSERNRDGRELRRKAGTESTEARRELCGLSAGADRHAAAPDADGDRLGGNAGRLLGALPASDAARGCDVDWGRYEPAIRRWADALGRPAPDPTEPNTRGGRRLNPAFVEWMQGLPLGHVTAVPGLSRNDQLRLLGNGVVPQQGAYALRLLVDAERRCAA